MNMSPRDIDSEVITEGCPSLNSISFLNLELAFLLTDSIPDILLVSSMINEFCQKVWI
jgi:hypothetical protein